MSSRPPVLHHAVVQAFKYEGTTAVPQGRVGAAVVPTSGPVPYQLILYRSKSDCLCYADIRAPNFSFNALENNYWSFHDREKHAWSVQFAAAGESRDFAAHVAIALCAAGGGRAVALVNLAPPPREGHALENGDMAGVRYTGWLVSAQTGALGAQVDSNASGGDTGLFRITIGDDDDGSMPGWHDTLRGMRKGGRRIAALPPKFACGAEGLPPAIPPNSTMVFEFEVVRVKKAGSDSAAPTPAKAESRSPAAPLPLPAPAAVAPPAMLTVNPPPPQQAQAQVQPQQQPQPQPQPQPQTPSSTATWRPQFEGLVALYNPRQQQQAAPQPQPQAPVVYQPPQPTVVITTPPVQQQQQQPQQQAAPAAFSHVELEAVRALVTEFRTEMKRGMNAMFQKVTELDGKVEQIVSPPEDAGGTGASAATTAHGIIMTLRKLADENDAQRKALVEKTDTIDGMRRRVQELTERSQRFVDDTVKTSGIKDDSQKRTIDELKVVLSTLVTEKAKLEATVTDLQIQLSTANKALASANEDLRASRDATFKLVAESELPKEERKQLEDRVKQLQELLKEEQKMSKHFEEQRDTAKQQYEEQCEAAARAERVLATAKVRYAEQMKQIEEEREAERVATKAQIARLNHLLSLTPGASVSDEKEDAAPEKKMALHSEIAKVFDGSPAPQSVPSGPGGTPELGSDLQSVSPGLSNQRPGPGFVWSRS